MVRRVVAVFAVYFYLGVAAWACYDLPRLRATVVRDARPHARRLHVVWT